VGGKVRQRHLCTLRHPERSKWHFTYDLLFAKQFYRLRGKRWENLLAQAAPHLDWQNFGPQLRGEVPWSFPEGTGGRWSRTSTRPAIGPGTCNNLPARYRMERAGKIKREHLERYLGLRRGLRRGEAARYAGAGRAGGQVSEGIKEGKVAYCRPSNPEPPSRDGMVWDY
jgi:hypothetical protein